jgi:hypothetical protein
MTSFGRTRTIITEALQSGQSLWVGDVIGGSDQSGSVTELDLAVLYDEHARGLHHYLARRVGPQTADDLVADAFLAVWEHRHRRTKGCRTTW